MKFQVGDRVRVYGHIVIESKWEGITFSGRDGVVVGVITEHYAAPGYLNVKFINDKVAQVSPKQCRKLVKKERRRLWIHSEEGGPIYGHGSGTCGKPTCIEFIEVVAKAPGKKK